MSKRITWGKILSGRIRSSGLAVGIIAVLIALLRISSTAQIQPEAEPRLLIARGESGLEWLVTEQLMQRFGDQNVVMDTVNVRKLGSRKNDRYDAVIVMGGVDRDRVTDRVLEHLTRRSNRSPGERTRFLITTVHGDLWSKGKTVIDAVSKATDVADAESIAKKIASLVESALESPED